MSAFRRITLVLVLLILLLSASAMISGCPKSTGNDQGEPRITDSPAKISDDTGEPEGPIRVAFVPSVEEGGIEMELDEFETRLSEMINHPVKAVIVLTYSACIEQMGAGHFEVAMLPSRAYVQANERYDVRVVLKAVRRGSATYRGMIITRADSGIKTLDDLNGKTFAFTDSVSASGFLYPKTLLIQNGIDPDNDLAESAFVSANHQAVVLAVLNGRFDAGACYDDARLNLLETEPDIMDQIVPIAYTKDIPSDTVSLREDCTGPFYDKFVQALMEISRDGEEGVLYKIYEIEELVPADDSDYDPIREMVDTLGLNLEELE